MTVSQQTLDSIKIRVVSQAEYQFNINTLRELLAENPNNDDARVLLAAWHAKTFGIVSREADREEAQAANARGPQSLDTRPRAGAKAANQFGTFQVHAASPAQLRYIQRLLGERDLSKVGSLAVALVNSANEDINSVNKKTASDLIEILLALPVLPNIAPTASNASDKQVAIIVRETARRVGYEPMTEAQASALSRKEASNLIDGLFAAPFTPRPVSTDAPLPVGVYRKDGKVFRVYPAKADKTRMLCKELLILAVNEEGHVTDRQWDYRGMASRFVSLADRMSKDEALAFGRDFAICVCCGALLEDPTSVERAIGPVCIKKYF